MRVISLFSGMEAASEAARAAGLGWTFAAFAEIDPHACAALHALHGCGRPDRMPDPGEGTNPEERKARARALKAVSEIPAWSGHGTRNLGDVSRVDWAEWRGRVDLLVGGPPCQSFSVAGLRRSLGDDRGNLSLAYARAVHETETPWSVTENVVGWLSTKDNAFGCFLGALVGAAGALPAPRRGQWGGAGLVDGPLGRAAWRTLDAQGFVPQRRRRVFVVHSRAGGGGDPAGVLFEAEAQGVLHPAEGWG